jgi:hypothetical protein
MNLYALPIGQAIDGLSPELRAWFDALCDSPHLADATTGEIFAMVYVLGYLGSVLSGDLPFDRGMLYQVLNLTAQDDPKWHRSRRGNGG